MSMKRSVARILLVSTSGRLCRRDHSINEPVTLCEATSAPSASKTLVSPVQRSRPATTTRASARSIRSEEHTSELQSQSNLVCRLLLEKKKKKITRDTTHVNSSHTQISYAVIDSTKKQRRVHSLFIAHDTV